MPALVNAPPSAAPLLQFGCGHCGVILSVPASMAGVEGPCPSCRKVLVAPSPPSPPSARERPHQEIDAPTSSRPHDGSAHPSPEVSRPTADRRSPLRRDVKKPKAERGPRAAVVAPPQVSDATAAAPSLSRRLWTWAAVGCVIGGGVVFGGLSAIQLRRDLSRPPGPASPATQSVLDSGNPDDALAALDEHKRQSTRDLKSLLAAQQVVWRFFAAPTAAECEHLVLGADDHPLPVDGLHSPLAGVTLRSKRRLPDDSGMSSQWAVATTRFGELVVEVSETSGQPRLNWTKLAPQLGLAPGAARDVRTAATP